MKLFRLSPFAFRLPFATLVSLLTLALTVAAQQAPPQNERNLPFSQRSRVTLADINVEVTVNKSVIVTMAALNVAGYDHEPGNRQLSALRKQLREDLKGADQALVRRLRNYLLAHSKGKTDATSVAPYLSLALTLTDPPAFSIDTAVEKLPEDVREITDFALLLEEFYRETKFARLMPKYLAAYQAAIQSYIPATAQVAGTVVSYLHTEPILELPPLYVPRPSPQKGGKKDAVTPERPPMRERRFIVMPDLLNATGAANLRVVRDSYYLLLGPTTLPNIDATRRAFLRFVIDPLTDRQVREVTAIKDELKKLRDSRGDKLEPEYAQNSFYFLITDSLVRAINERLDGLEAIASRQFKDEKEFKRALDDAHEEALYQLSLAYERGAVLVYHFYDQMRVAEGAGVNLRDYFASLLDKIDFEREAKRLDEYAQRLARWRQAKLAAAANPLPAVPTTISNADEQIVAQLDQADKLIRTRQYADARAVLEAARRQRPNNARALFGLAEVGSKLAAAMSDTDRRDEELFAAVELYKQAAQHASPETEKWLAQRSYLTAGKILEFLDREDDAMAAYDLAIKIGKVPEGVYDEAVKAKQQREQKPKP